MNHKICESELKDSDKKKLTVTHFISTERVDRGGDILYADGMAMNGRPVVLLQHGHSNVGMEPIAKPLSIVKAKFKDRKGIEAKTQFFPDELGQRLWQKASSGYMPNWSVGWLPIRHEYKTDEAGREIRHVYEWELLEYSLVGVPMQPDAQSLSFKIINDPRITDVGFPYLHDGKLVIWVDDKFKDKISQTVHRELQRNKEGKLTVHIDDQLVKKTIRETVHQHLNKLRGKVD